MRFSGTLAAYMVLTLLGIVASVPFIPNPQIYFSKEVLANSTQQYE